MKQQRALKPSAIRRGCKIYRMLVRAGDPGLAVGKLQSRLSIPASTLSHHLKTLHHRRARHPGARCHDPDLPGQLSGDARLGRVPGGGMLHGSRLRLDPAASRHRRLDVLPIISICLEGWMQCRTPQRQSPSSAPARSGLAAAAHALERGLKPIVLEAGDSVGHAVRQWSHVRMFSPWTYNVDKASEALLRETGWNSPDPEQYPTGGELVEHYLEPLATRTRLSRAHPDQRAGDLGGARRASTRSRRRAGRTHPSRSATRTARAPRRCAPMP